MINLSDFYKLFSFSKLDYFWNKDRKSTHGSIYINTDKMYTKKPVLGDAFQYKEDFFKISLPPTQRK